MVNYSNLSLPNALETFCLLLSLDSLVFPTSLSCAHHDTVGASCLWCRAVLRVMAQILEATPQRTPLMKRFPSFDKEAGYTLPQS